MIKTIIHFSLCFLLVRQAHAQVNYQPVANRFLQFFNKEQADSIFSMYAPELKEKLPSEKNKAVMNGLHVQYGELRSLEIIKQDTGYAKYKAGFKDQTLILVFALN